MKTSVFYIIIIVFHSNQHAIENRSACLAWNACRRLPTPDLFYMKILETFHATIIIEVQYRYASYNDVTVNEDRIYDGGSITLHYYNLIL
jgi:hypothetical protein